MGGDHEPQLLGVGLHDHINAVGCERLVEPADAVGCDRFVPVGAVVLDRAEQRAVFVRAMAGGFEVG